MRLNKFFFTLFIAIGMIFTITCFSFAEETEMDLVDFDEVSYFGSNEDENSIFFWEVLSTKPWLRAEIQNVKASGSIKGIKLAVWSTDKGQDDLVWYNAKTLNGNYYSDIILTNHKSLGRYNVHCYAVLSNGKMEFLSSATFNTNVPTAESITIDSVDANNGIIKATIAGVENRTGLDTLHVYAICDSNPDKVFWYDAERVDATSYEVKIDLKDNGYKSGKYTITATLEDLEGKYYYPDSDVCEIKVDCDDINVSDKTGKECEYAVNVKNPVVPGGFKNIKVAVWSKANGQDDIVWYTAGKSGTTYSFNVPIKNHRTAGTYHVHVYATSKLNKMVLIGTDSFTVEAKNKASVLVENIDRVNGKAQIKIYAFENISGVNSVKVPIWSKSDQSDIKWYVANKQDDGSYTVEFDIKNHGKKWGKYNCYAQVTLNNGISSYAYRGNFEITKQSSDKYVSVDIESEPLVCKELKNVSGYYRVSVKKPVIASGFDRIEYAVWSDKNGKDDMLWFNALVNSSGEYYSDISMLAFNDYGTYNVNAYAVLNNGQKALIDTATFKIQQPKIEKVSISDLNLQKGTFKVTLSGVKNTSALKKVMVSVRCTANQSKVAWYDATKVSGEDKYIVTCNIAKNDYEYGKYIVDAYVVDLREDKYCTAYTTQEIKISYTNLFAENKDGKELKEGIFLTDLVVPGGAKNVKFAVWSDKGGQDDIKWYTADVSGVYHYYYAPIINHKTLGNYKVHVYATKQNGKQVFVGATNFEIKNKATGKVKISDVNRTKGTFKVTVYDIDAPAGVKTVQVPVWSKSNQSDIKWYTATNAGNGTYTVTAKVSNHKHNFGTYKAHAYVTMANGIKTFVDNENVNIQPLNYIKYEKLNSYSARITVLNAGNGSATKVQFPTWSLKYGQDDIKWYNGTNLGNGNWSFVIDTGKHKSYGDMTTHVYVTANGKRSGVGSINYSLKGKDYSVMMSRFTTISQNNANGTFNMSKALLSFNNVVIQPGQTLSFFAQAGPCGYAQGYLVAGTVQGTGYGGGICQASTTLYGAALRGGMTIIERRSHSSRSVYVPVGQDAMVSYGSSDLKFRNDHDFPVKIVTYVIGRTLYAEIWGLDAEWYDDVVINSWATGSNTAAAERVFYKNGMIVKRERLTNSYYPKG